MDRDGDGAILDVLGPGDLVGELEAADGGVRHANELRVAHFPDDPERRLAGRLLRLAAEPVRGGLTVARNSIAVRSVDALHRLAGRDAD